MSSRTETFTIERSLPGERLDTFLRARFPVVSRGAIQRLIEEGYITVNGRTVKPTLAPHAGDTVSVTWPEARPAEAQPEDIPLNVLHEDDALLVVNKDPGLVVHPAAGNEDGTLVNALLHHCRGQLSGIGGVARPGIVHRLDKETSGCLVVAKSDDIHVALSTQFAQRSVHKVYDALLCGELPREKGDIRAAIARHPSHRKRMAVRDEDEGREAWTSYQVAERLNHATHAQAVLHTGRTHQIRVHFLHLGYPLVGDETYGHRQNRRLEELTGFKAPRVMLHARELTLLHPRTGKRIRFEAPLPADFQDALQFLRVESPPSDRLGGPKR
jgi:23S rRNA pseudouridine1911/1915/1917 synthase